jgi:ribosomal protein S18 acetylase RimI-like enzyme
MKIRKFKKQDIDRCLDIECSEERSDNREIVKSNFLRELNDDRSLVLVAEINNEVAGFIDGRIDAWNNSFYIEQLFIDRGQRGKGCGSKLISEVIKTAKKLKLRIIFVDLPPQNKNAMRFYLKNGFQKAGKINELYNNPKRPNSVILSQKL